ncbi:MAG: pyridoxamine 5'-phosphate oxidase family protein [Candidatus Micrarchaeota archaeon]|nr:pyridoxamine 5'-phosphate oxidase family protein [Candidatus Micrarchaeota archaeon]
MEKTDREEVWSIAKGILDKCYLMSLATADEGGAWVAQVVYIADSNFNLYWLSDQNSRHSRAIEKDPRVAASICPISGKNQETEALQISGIAQKIEGDPLDLARMRSAKLGIPVPESEGETLVYNDRRFKGKHAWYRLTPRKIDLLFKKRFGDDKAFLEM